MRFLPIFLAALALLLAAPSFAQAQPAPSPLAPAPAPPSPAPAEPVPQVDEAAALFEQGVALAKKGAWGKAYAMFEAAYERRAGSKVEAHKIEADLGLAEAHLGKYPEAVAHLTEALAAFPFDTEEQRAQRAHLEAALVDARAHLPQSAPPPSAPPTPTPTATPTATPSATATAASTAPATPSARPFHPGWLAAPLVAAAGAAAAGLAVRAKAGSDNADIQALLLPCATAPANCAVLAEAQSNFDRDSAGAIGALSAGAALLAASGVMLYFETQYDQSPRFHRAFLYVPIALGAASLAAAAGLQAALGANSRRYAASAQSIYQRSGAAGCADPASAADCQTNASAANASSSLDSAALALGIVGGAAIVSSGAVVAAYFAGSREQPKNPAEAAFVLAPTVGRQARGIALSGGW